MIFTDYFSPEKDIIKEKFTSIPYMDVWVSSIVEGYIYENVTKVNKYGDKEEYTNRYGKKDGEYKMWYRGKDGLRDNLQLWIHQYYKEGELEGEYKWWYPNGQLSEQCFYKKGKFEGEYKSWHEHGKLQCQCYYKEGKCKGEYNSWYENGQLEYQAYYKEGERNSEYTAWHPNGQMFIKTYLENEKKIEKIWNKKGQLYSERVYNNEVLLSYKIWNKKGRLLDSKVIHSYKE